MKSVLQHCDPVLLDQGLLNSCGDSQQLESAEAAQVVLHLMDSRRVQKVVWRQLFVLDSIMSLLEELKSSQQLVSQPCPPLPGSGARSTWKSLKVQFMSSVEETETLLQQLQNKVQQTEDRRHRLRQLLCRLDDKKEQCEQLKAVLLKSKNALQGCEDQLIQLRAQSEAVQERLNVWQQVKDCLQVLVSAHRDVTQITLLSVEQSELCVELRPRPSSKLWTNQLEPLRLKISWSSDQLTFSLQVEEGPAGLLEDSFRGRYSELSAALLEVMQCYMGEAELLLEVQKLRSSFAIDWRPSQRLLVYLKSATVVCHLQVEEGYPSSGVVRLQGIVREGQTVDISGLKCQSLSSLTEWLLLLHDFLN
ncbi:uncharacterized protein LOC103393408 isoform X2 [Cynoglossus semilaevis]|uniref:uncharacterized protein LOC103393408 isoform X2 n=1 Tax=Cynoglossus semilaevis TaxID=244447 RepID=UPI000495C5DC|nr:uncharacterized protein LOC103393408 isoform X2 [Cynoglossus semilaevis]